MPTKHYFGFYPQLLPPSSSRALLWFCLHLFPLFFFDLDHGCVGLRRGSPEGVRQGQRSPRQALPQAGSQRIHEGGDPDGHRVRGDGLRGFLREADLYPHQQHYRRIGLGKQISFA